MKEACDLIGVFSEKVVKIISAILELNFDLILVGGYVRDFYRNEKPGNDLDFELVYKEKLEGKNWEAQINNLIQLIEKKFSCEVEKLPFLIVKITDKDFSMELTPPRLEHYENKDQFGHSDFSCQIFSQMDSKKSFLRRDITVNSIGIKLQLDNPLNTILIDPSDGLADLKKNVIRTVNPDFYKDPVRFLRIIRFSINLKMKFDPELEKHLSVFNLSMLTAHHFFKEAFKCDFFLFTGKFFKLTDKHDISLPQQLNCLSFLKQPLARYAPQNKKEVLALLVFNEVRQFNKNELITFVKFSSISKNYLRHLEDCKSLLNELEDIFPDILKEKIKILSVEEMLKENVLEAASKFFSFFKKRLINETILNKCLPQKKAYTWKMWRKYIPDHLAGEKLFFKLSQSLKIKPKNKSYLRLYAHLKKKWS